MAYGYSSKKLSNKKSLAKTRQMEPRLLLASLVMAAGVFAYPLDLGEAAIVRENGTVLDASGLVHNIDPEKVVSNDFAYNRFKEFDLNQGHIANLRFGEASTLANLVNKQININGIVNAVKNGNIDGHLIFLSPDGIAVGSSGVINAGQFTGLVPTRTDFDALYNTPASITLAAVNALNTGSFATGKKVEVSGKINTHSGVMLGAGIINIQDGAVLQSTKSLDFTQLVNIKNGDTIQTNAGLGGLTAVEGSGGDIIIMAKQESAVKDTKITKDQSGNDQTEANPIRWKDRSTDLSAAINIGTDAATKGVSINSSAGAVKLTAESTSTYEDSTPMTLTDTLKGIVLGEDTIVDGLLNKLASKEASANKYLYVNYSGKKNKSAINIGQKSSLEGQSIDIAATSKVEIKQSVAVPSQGKDSNGNSVENTSAMPVAAVAISRVYNTADVVIDGNLTANGADAETGDGIKIAANADTKAELSATAGGGANTSAVVGVAVLTGDTKSKVTVNAPTDATALTASNGRVSVGADSTSDINVNVNAVGQSSYVVSNVGVVNYDTNADVLMERSINAGAVDIKAATNTTGMKLTVDNEAKTDASDKKNTAEASQEEQNQDDEAANAEKNKPDSEKSQDEKNSEKKSIDPNKVLKDANVDTNDAKTNDAAGTDGKGGVKDVKDKLEGTNEGGDNAKKNSAFGLGAAVGVVSNKNDANITIGKNAVITATKVSDAVDGSVKVSADSLMTASKENEDSLGFKVNNTQANANAEIGAAVLVSNVKNDVKIVLDNEGDKSAQIKGTEVSLDASAGMGKYNKTENEVKDSTLSYNVSAKGTAENDTPSKFALDGSVGINTLKNNAVVLAGQKSKVDGSSVKLSADATTNAEGTYGATEENGKVGIGATVGLQNIRGNALVMTGKGAEIKGTESIEASASNSMDLKNQVKNAGKGDSIGVSGMVALSYGDSNSVVSLDDETNLTTGLATITSTNATNIDNSARSESTGQNGAKAFGIGVGIVNYDVNSLAMISDNGSGITAPLGNTTDAEKAAKKIYEDGALARSIAGDTLAGKLGNKTANGTKGSITTGGLVGAAITTGMIQNDAKAKVVTASSNDGDENERQDSEKWTKWSKQGTEGANEAKTNTQNLENTQEEGENHDVTSQNESAAPNATGVMGEASRAADPDGTNNTADDGAAPTANSHESAGASIGIEGSVALTFLGGRTDAVLDNVTVKNGTEAEPAPVAAVSLSGMDFLGSITMGGTNIKHSVNADSSETKVGIGGTFAMNSSNRDVDSLIRNTDMPMALMVSNSASKIGIEVAAGMGVSTAEGDGANINGAGVVYYNKAKQDIQALMLNNNVMGASLSNKAISTDFQIAGGLSGIKGSGANTNVGVGGAVAISQLENNLSSGIIGGNYTVSSSVDVEAQKGTTQINGALAGTKGGYGFEGAFAYGSTKNNTHAYIDGATVTGLADSAVNVKAGESPVVKSDTQLSDEKTKSDSKIDSSVGTNPNSIDTTKTYTTINDEEQTQVKTQLKSQTNSALEKEKKAQDDNKKTLDDMGLDTTGESYLDKRSAASSLDDVNKDTDEGKAAGDAAKDEDDAKAELGKNHSLTISAAMGGGWNENVGVGAGIAYNYVKNDIAADIKGSTIAAATVNGEAASDATIVSVGAGVAIGGKTFNGAGSGSWNDLKNDTKVTFANNTITGKNISEQAQNTSSIINIAGEVAGGKGMAMGLSLAYNSLNNTTGTYLTGNTVTLDANGTANSVKLATTNQSKALAVAGGINVNASQSVAGAVGTVAINKGVNNTESVIDGKTTGENTKLDNVSDLSVTAEELAKRTTVAGSVSVGGKKVGVGGAVAYAAIGSSSNRERLRAEINHADITTTNNGKIEVSTKDSKTNANNELEKSRAITVGAGFGVQWGKNFFNLQGGAAVSDIYKNSFAALNNSNINATNVNAHPTIDVTADTMSRINTVGVGGSVDISTSVKGTAGVAINRMYHDTKAEMATDSADNTTTVNAGLTQVRATGDGDIHSVGVGGTVGVGGHVAFAGSMSYNYIGNNVDAVIKNQNLTANSSIGVVARSDDRLYNFAGGFAIGANTKAGLGAAVSINKIIGNTNALVQGGILKATDTGSVKVTRPQDDNLFTTEKLELTTDRQRLSENRQESEKTGIVVDSSATHTLISQLSSGGVAASGSVGVDLAGTVNLNTVSGSTTAKINDANINSAGNYSDVNVNAVDYTNFGAFTGTPAVGAAGSVGVSVGVSANWETMERTTAAEIVSPSAKKSIYANNLIIDAMNKHGSSNLAFAVAVGVGGTAGVASGDSIVRHKNNSTTSALLKNTNAVFAGKAEIQAEHLGNSRTLNIGGSLSGGYGTVAAGAGVSVMDDTSTVKSEVNNSDLKANSNGDGKNISVLAKNENNWKNTLVTASAAVGLGAGLAANVGINNTTSETSATVFESNLEAADVTVKATDKLVADSTGGVGAAGIGGVGVSVALNNINSSVSANVSGGEKGASIQASQDINVIAEEERKFDSSVTGVAVGGIGVGVNVAVTSINKGITDAQLSDAKDENGKTTDVNNITQNEINVHLNGAQGVNSAKGALGVSGAKFYGLNAGDKADLENARNTTISLFSPTYSDKTPDTKKQGIHTVINGRASLTAAERVNVTAKETSDISTKNVSVNVGGMSVGVTDAIIHTNHDTDVTIDNASIAGKHVAIEAVQGQQDKGSDITVTAVSVGAGLGVGVGYAGIVNKGSTDVNIADSTIGLTKGEAATANTVNTEDINIKAQDKSKSKTQITNVGVAALNVTTTFASVENEDNVGVTLGGTSNLSAATNITIDAEKANALEAHTQGVGVGGVNVAVNHATIEDKGKAAAKITGTTGKYTAEAFHFGAINDTTAKLSAGNTAVSVLGVSRMRGKGVMNMGAEVEVAGGTFNAKLADFSAQLGNANGRTLEGNVKGHNVSAVAVAPDAVILNTDATSKVIVNNSTFAEDTDLYLTNVSNVDRKAYIYGVTAGAVAVGNTSADISGTETMESILNGKNEKTKLNSLKVITYGENIGKAFADAGGGGLVGYVGAHVDNKSTNKVTSSLSGKWETKDDVWLIAAQNDNVRLTASEGHGGVAGVGGTSVDNTINTTSKATIADDTEITSNRIHVGTDNTVTTGAYDDTDSKGNNDVQTYTLKDHFGGVISGNRLRSLLNLTETGTVNIGKNAKITTNKLQEYIASSDNNLTNLVQAKGGGAVAVTDAVSEFNIGINNKVNVESGAIISNEKAASTEDIILAAYDNQKIKSQVDGTVYAGVISPIVTKNIIGMNRTSDVAVAGKIDSGSKVGLYAGANKDGVLSNLNADLKSGAYNYSVISITTPRVNYNILADKGTVDVSGIVRATGDINVTASGGKEEIVKDQSLWNWALGGSSTNKTFLTSDAVVAEETMPKQSTVNVTGALIAGTANPINLTISGSIANGLTITAPDNDANNRVKNGIKDGTFDYATSLAARWDELTNLIASYKTKTKASDNKDYNDDLLVAYVAERDRIQNEMVSLGLAEKDDKGNYVYVKNGRPVYFVEIPDIATGGGNINVTANDFKGNGKLRANSAPGVTITNQSDAYLKLNNILMGEQGGKIVYNGADNVIPANTSEGNTKINGINVSKTGASFSEIYGVTNGDAASLLVDNTFSGSKESTIHLTDAMKQRMRQEVQNDTSLSDDNKNQLLQDINTHDSFTYTAIPNVEINGKISNFHGNVTIRNASGDIRINSGTQSRPTGVEGNTVSLVAAKGTIAQGYQEGIVNINGNPEMYLDDFAKGLKTKADNYWNPIRQQDGAQAVSLSHNDNGTFSRPDTSQTATGYIAGRDVYVSAAYINVNGLIQSGYKNYVATVTDEQLATAQNRSSDRSAIVQNRTMFKVNDGGVKWNDTDKVFDYVPQVYWDPSTKQLFVEDIDTQGGKVYLTGRIASTGDGRIRVADGAANISVTNETSLDMNVGNVLNNRREGVVTIVDLDNDMWTEFRNGQMGRIYNYSQHLKETAQNGGDINAYAGYTQSDLSYDKDSSYKSLGYKTYNWTKGEIEGREVTKQHYVRYGLWGAVKTMDINEIKADTKNVTIISPEENRKYGLPEGAAIKAVSFGESLNSNTIYMNATNTMLSNEVTNVRPWMEKTGFIGWFRNYYTRWTEKSSTAKMYNFSIKADNDISIGLIGTEQGGINLSSTNIAGGNINLTGNVANSHNAAPLTINSAGGGIFQKDGTTLKSEVVNLTAKNDIKNIHIASIGSTDGNKVTDNIKLSAVSTRKGDIDITAVGGLLNNQSLPGNVEIVALKSRDDRSSYSKDIAIGNVTLNAKGNITQSDSGVIVEGRGINLTSKNGGIGTAEQAVQIAGSDLVYATDRSGALVNASAKDSIYLTEEIIGGDMRVGKIESREGDVTLTVRDGSFIDALPGDDKSGSMDSVDDMVHRWIDAGLIDGEKDGNGQYTYKGAYIEGLEKNRDDYKANVEAAYDVANGGKTQAQWQAEYTGQKPAVEEIYASAEYKTYLANKAKYDALSQEDRRKLADRGDSAYLAYAKSAEQYAQYSNYATAEAYLKDTAAYKYSQYANAADYLATDTTYKDLAAKAANPTFEWTKDMMLYAVSDKLVNPEGGGSAQTDRAANVLGKNITLNTNSSVGTFADQTTTITMADLTGNNSIEKMKQLMKVGASDVKAKRDANGKLTAFEITPNMPLGVKASGTLNVAAGGNVSVAGRKDAAGEYSAINVGTIDAKYGQTTFDVRLHSEKGIYNALADDGTNIKGKNLILTGGKESIGTSEKPLTVSLTKDLTEVRADKNVFINNTNNNDYLRLGAMFAGDTISLNSYKGFKMSAANLDIAESYINAGQTLKLNANTENGIVGENNNPIRILNDRAPVNIEAQSAYIRGMGSLGIQNGTLVLGKIKTTGAFTATSDGSLAVGREAEKDNDGNDINEAVAGSIQSGGDVTLDARDALTLDGAVTTGDLQNKKKTLTLKAVNGDITQMAKGTITADKVNTFNGKSLLLENTGNQFNSITVDSGSTADIAGDVRIKDNADALTVQINQKVAGDTANNLAGDISVQNLKANGTLTNEGNLTAAGSISFNSRGDLAQKTGTVLTAGKDVNATSTDGAMLISGDIAASNGNITLSAKEDMQTAGMLTANQNVNATSTNGAVIIDGTITANDSIVLKADDALAQGENVLLVAGKDVTLTSVKNAITQEASAGIQAPKVTTVSAKDVDLQGTGNKFNALDVQSSDKNVPIQGSVSVLDNIDKLALSVQPTINGDIAVENQKANGVLQVASELHAKGDGAGAEGDISLKSDGSMKTDKKITAANDVNLTSTSGAMTVDGDVSANQDITLLSKANMQVDGQLMASNDVNATSTDGAMVIGGDMSANQDITLQSKGDMQVVAPLTAGNDVNIMSVDGAMTIDDDISSEHDITLESQEDMQVAAPLTAGNDLIATSANGAMSIDGDVSVNKDIILKSMGDMQLDGQYIAGNDVSLHSTDGAMIIGGDVSANKDIVMESQDDMHVTGQLTAGNNVNVTSTDGAMTIDDDISAEHDITLESQEDMQVAAPLTAGNDLTATSANGAMTIDGDVSVNNDIILKSMGDMQLDGQYIAGNDVSLHSTDGAMIIGGDVSANKDIVMESQDDMHVTGQLTAGNNVNVTSTDGAMTIDDDISAEHDITLESQEDMQVAAPLTAGNDLTATSANGAMTIDGAVTATGDIKLESQNDMQVVAPLTAGNDVNATSANGAMSIDGDVSVNNDIILKSMGDMQLDGQYIAGNDVSLHSTDGAMIIGGDVSANKDIVMESQDDMHVTGQLTAGNNVNVTSTDGAMTIDDDISAEHDIVLEARADMQVVAPLTAGNDVNVISTDGAMNIDGDVSATRNIKLDSQADMQVAAPLTAGNDVNATSTGGAMTIDDVVSSNQNITLESQKDMQIVGQLSAGEKVNLTSDEGNMNIVGDITANQDIALNSYETTRTTGKLTTGQNVHITTTIGDVFIDGDITTGKEEPSDFDFENLIIDPGEYNYLDINAGGAIQEAEGVTIDTPLVDIHSGNGVSMESTKNEFSVFLAEALEGSTGGINGSVKATTSLTGEQSGGFMVGVGADIHGDAAFTNLNPKGDLGIMILHPSDAETEIKVLGGDDAKGNLALTANRDVLLLGDANAKNDISISSKDGSFYGVGRGIHAGHNVNVSSGDGVYYLGGAMEAGNDILVQSLKPVSDNAGIYIGALPDELADKGSSAAGKQTLLTAGREARFEVQGDGNIALEGNVVADTGDAVANISGEGSVVISKSVGSNSASVSVKTDKGHILIGTDNKQDEDTIKAQKNVNVETNLGNIIIQGRTLTENGDITMKAGKEEYESGKDVGNFIIRDDGKIDSGGNVVLNGKNGDIYITDDILAKKGIMVNVANQGNVFFDRDVAVTNEVAISTDKGSIAVGHTVSTVTGAVNLSTDTGDILIGKDVTAGKSVLISSNEGNVVIGDVLTGDDGDVLAQNGDVSIKTNAGNVEIVKTVTSPAGSIDISTNQGDILIGNNGEDVKTVAAKDNLSFTTGDGKVVVYGKTSTEEGDISLAAHGKPSGSDEDYSSFVIDQNGQLESGRSVLLTVGNGDVYVSDRIKAKEDLAAEISEKGSVIFATDVNVNGNVNVITNEGDIVVGHEVRANKDINMVTNQGDIAVGSFVVSTGGSIDVQVKTGDVMIGDNGPEVDTVAAKDNINVDVDLGRIKIYGKTSTQTGDISMSAGDNQYTPGMQNIIIEQNGAIDSGRDVKLVGRNGDLHVTDAIRSKRNLEAKVRTDGGVYFEKTAIMTGDTVLAGNVIYTDGIVAQTDGTPFRLSLTGPDDNKLIGREFYVGSLRSKYGTKMPSVWGNSGYLHVDEGDLAVDDIFAVDKIRLENNYTNMAIYGRIPTKDGEQLVYWNNLDMANSKARSMQLYTDGKVRTHGTILIDAYRNYDKLYGDNLSVVDMMRHRVTNPHGQYIFDSKMLTEPGRLVREPMLYGVDSTDVIIQQQNASDGDIVVE